MTPGWRRWTAILTTYICLFAGVIAYRIRVPPPGQLVALSGDDLRVELDLPPPGRVDGGGGGLLEAAVTPDSRSRRQGDAGGGEDASARAVRRDGELWIELVDMEMGVEIARRRRKETEEEAEGEERRRRLQEAGGGGGTKREGGRWRREEGGGSGGGETMGRREIGGGWNSVGDSEGKEAEGKKKSKEEEEEVQTKEGKRRYEWVAGGVRPKGEKENALRAMGKESEGPNKWAGGDRWGGKLRWRSWNGRTGGFGGGNAVKMTDDLEKSGAREKKGGGGVAGGAGGQKSQEEAVGEGEAAREAGKDGEEGDGEGEEEVRGLILETALVSRGWHLPASAASPRDPPDRGPSPPHSTLALTFPASHFTHGGLYVVRLVGTGRVVSNPGTQRPQRDTVTTEGALEGAGGGAATDGRRGDENHAKEEGRKPEGTREAKIGGVPVVTDKRGGKNETAGSGKKGKLLVRGEKEGVGGERGRKEPAMNLPPASRSDDVHRGREEVRTEGGEDKETVKRMYGRILEALENRERWEEYDRGAVPPGRKSSGGMDGSGTLSGRRVGRRRKREETGDSSGSRQKTADERRRDPRPPLQEGGGLPSAADGEVRGLKWPDSAVSDYGESLLGGVRHKTAGQWLSGGIGGRVVSKSWGDREEKLSEERESGEDSERMKALEGLTATRRGGGTSEEVSGTEMNGSPSSFLRTYLEDKASDGGGKRGKDAAGRKGYREEGDVASASEVEVKRRRRNEEGNYFEEPVIDRLSLSPGTENYDFADLHRFSSKSSRLQKRDLEESTEEGTIEKTETNTSQNTSTTEEVPKYATTEGRVSREVSKGCKDNCDTTATSRHILAEENVLVSWPAARFTLNILSSSSSFSSSATKPQTEKSARNLTFETFEAPVRVLVEIPCGIEGVGSRGRRDVVVEGLRKTFYAQESGESGRMSVKVSKDESAMEAGKSTGRLRVMSTAMQENQKDGQGESDTKDNTGADTLREGGEPKRKKKGARGENERLWKDLESGGRGREKRELKGEQNHLGEAPGIPSGGAVTERMLTAGDGEEEAYHAEEYTEANSPRGIVMRIRKERVTKYDINDDALESLEEKAGSLGSSGYAMKREVSAGLQEPTREVKSVPGERIPMGPERSFKVEPWMTNEDDQASRGGEADGRSGGHSAGGPTRVKRAPTTAGSTRNPKTGLSPGPPKLPFRVFLVLRYCGVDSTECDEEDSGKDNVEIWRRPQTVFTKELVDFPACPKYQHQVILPCEAFGQAGVYVVQVRSNYTLEAVEDGGGGGKAQGRRRKRRAEGETVGDQPEERLTSKQSNKHNNYLSGITGKKSATESNGGYVTDDPERRQSRDVNVFVAESTSRVYGEMRGGKSTTDTLGIARENGRIKSKGSPKDPEDIQDRGDVKGKHKGDLQGRRGHEEEVLGTTFGGGTGMFDAVSEEGVGEGRPPPLSRKPRGSAWEMGGSSWWEFGSGDGGDTDEGSGDWGEGGGWPDDAGRGRREGSGDAEYGDDPDGGSDPGQSSSRRKLPDPPPGSLWTSSESITVRLSTGYVFTVHARSVFPCSDAHVRPGTLEPAPSGVPVLFEYPECILDASDRIRVFGRARPDVAAILPPFWMGTDASTDAAVTLSHPSLRYVAEKKIYKGKHNAWFDCSLFTERYSEYCFAYASEAMTGAVTHVRAQCIPTLPTSDKDRGGWGSWSSWSQCSTTCGSGSRNRYRTCDNPPPRYGAPFCEGPALETEICPPPAGVTYEELQEMCPLGLALNAADDANRKGNEPNCRCGGCVVHLQGVAGSWTSRNAGPIKPRARLIASSSQACPGRSFWLLQAEPGHVVGLTVSSLLLPCPRRQWLKARDGDSLSSRLVLHLPSSASAANGAPAYSTEALCFSTGPHLLLEFYSFERLEASCNGGFLAHAHQVLANSSASAIGRDILLTPTTRAVPRSSLSVHAVALAFILALLALSGGLALNYVLRRRRFNEELKKREKEEEEMSDSDSDTKCFIARNKDGGSATSVTSVSDVISLRRLSVGKDRKERREVHMRLTEESDEDDEEEEEEDGGGVGRRGEGVAGKEEEGTTKSSDHNEPAKANLPRVEVLRPGPLKRKRSGGARSRRRARVETAARGGVRGVVVEEEEEEDVEEDVEEGGGGQQEDVQGDEEMGGGGGEEDEGADGVVAPEVTRRRRRKAGGSVGRREWRESACPLLEPETPVAQSSISLPSSPTEALAEDPAVTPNAPGRPGLSASAPLLLRRSLSFFAATASASSAGASGDAPPEGGGVAQSISAAGKQWWRKKMQRFQNGSVSPVREELEETWRLAEPHSPGKKKDAKAKKRPAAAGVGDAAPPAKECKEKQNRERLLRAGGSASPVVLPGVHHHAPSPNASESPSATTSPEMSRPGSNGGGRLRGRLLRATRAADGKCTSEASLAGGVSELDLEFDYYDYNVQNAGAAPGSYLGMDPAFLVYIPPFEGSTSPSSNASSASTLQAPPSEGGTDALLSASSSPQPPKGGGAATHRGDYYCINASYARANFQEMNGSRNGVAGGSEGEMMSMAEFRRSSVEDEEEEEESEEGRGSEKETRVEKSPVEDVEELEEDEIKFADEDDDEEEEEDSERAKMEGTYGVITAEGVGLKKPV